MNFKDYNNSIFIIEDKAKDSVLRKVNSLNMLLNIKIITLSEFKKKYFFDYTKETVFYVSNKYNVISDIAKIYIENLYFDSDLPVEKLEFLHRLKKELKDKKLIFENRIFVEFLKNKKIVLYNLDFVDKFYINAFKTLDTNNIIRYTENNNNTKKELYTCLNKNEEVEFVASSISNLLNAGVEINKIYLTNVQSDYNFAIKNIFKLFNIPVELDSSDTIKGTLLVQKFKELYSENIGETLSKVHDYVNGDIDEKIYNKIVSIINEYNFCENYESVKNMIFSDIDKIKLPRQKLTNAVRLIDFKEDIILEDEYVYLLNFNEGVIPSNSKDEDFLNDEIKNKLGLSTSVDLNISKKEALKKRIKETNHLILSYSKRNLTSELYISNLFEPELFEIKDYKITFAYSDKFNKVKLVANKDENVKFGVVSNDLLKLDNHYKNYDYMTYDNSYKKINIALLNNYLNHKLQLSYTSMNMYYECSFKYYLQYILKIDKYEDTFQAVIGNVFHKILSECFKDETYNLSEHWKLEVEKVKYEFDDSETYFLNTLQDELDLIVSTIKSQLENTTLKKTLYENEIIVPVDNSLNITFKGIVDKILYDNFETEEIVAIIDYKTGNPSLNIKNAEYGLEMQLPVYIYLIKNSTIFKNVKIGGFYLQKILNNLTDKNKRIDSMKLQGYSNSNISILSKVDTSYSNSNFIKSLKMSNDKFYAYSKVISDKQIDDLSYLVGDKIKDAGHNIVNAEFNINPKQIKDKLIGCNFCKYSDICYKKNKDIVKLQEIKASKIMGGETDANMD